MVGVDHWSQRPGPVAVYRYFNAEGALMYVGSTENLEKRHGKHRSSSWWWAFISDTCVSWYPSREEAEDEERRAYAKEHPLYNKRIPTRWTKPAADCDRRTA